MNSKSILLCFYYCCSYTSKREGRKIKLLSPFLRRGYIPLIFGWRGNDRTVRTGGKKKKDYNSFFFFLLSFFHKYFLSRKQGRLLAFTIWVNRAKNRHYYCNVLIFNERSESLTHLVAIRSTTPCRIQEWKNEKSVSFFYFFPFLT